MANAPWRGKVSGTVRLSRRLTVISVTFLKTEPLIIDGVGILRKSVRLGMALILLSAPLLACSLPSMTMSEEEQECCRHMAHMCGDAQMDESHSCCTKLPSLSSASLQPTVKFSLPLPDITTVIASATPLPTNAWQSGLVESSADRCSKSPPGQISVLRI